MGDHPITTGLHWRGRQDKLWPTMDRPETRYVTVDGAQVAYQIVGDGPEDLLWCYGLGGHIDLFWTDPLGVTTRFMAGLAAFRRLIVFDHRGTGASDPSLRNPLAPWEEMTEDMTAVLDAAGSNRAAVLANLESGPTAVLFAAMHPDRVSGLILRNTTARWRWAEDYTIGMTPDASEAMLAIVASAWGTEEMPRLGIPSMTESPEWVRWVAMVNRASVTPRAAVALLDGLYDVDVRPVLSLINAPTLVVHAVENPMMPLTHGRYLAEHIDGATLIEMPGGDIGHPGDDTSVADIAEFLTGERPPVDVDRILATVLFTDIVGSTERAASLGDRRWGELLDSHDQAVREQLRRFRGNEINTTGDGFVASFDGPARAIRCAHALIDATRSLGIEVRAGLHTGECEIRGDDLGGLAVHIAARVAALAAPGEVMASSTVKELVVGSGIEFADRGEHELKGVPGTWNTYAAQG